MSKSREFFSYWTAIDAGDIHTIQIKRSEVNKKINRDTEKTNEEEHSRERQKKNHMQIDFEWNIRIL